MVVNPELTLGLIQIVKVNYGEESLCWSAS